MSYRSVYSRWRISVMFIPLVLLGGLGAWLWVGGFKDGAPIPRAPLTGPLPDRLQPVTVPAPVEVADPAAVELTVRVQAALRERTRTRSPGPSTNVHQPSIPSPGAVEPGLLPKSARLSESQQRQLALLRWRQPGKVLDWRTAAEKPTLTFLAGRLLEPAASFADAGRSLHATTAARFLDRNRELLGLQAPEAELTLRSESTDHLGYTQLRFDQRHEGLAVWPCGLMVQCDPHGHVTLFTGSYVPTPADLDPVPVLSVESAVTLARAHSLETRLAALQESELLVHAPMDGPARLAWRVDLRGSLVRQWDVLVDARDGSILTVSTQIATTATAGTGTDEKGISRTINLWRHTDNRFYMIDASKQMFDPSSSPPSVAQSRGIIAVLDLQNSTEINPAAGVHSIANASTGPWRSDAVSASNNLSRVYDYYRARFNRNSVNGTGGTMVGMVNLNDDNAYADFQTQTMFFGNRDLYSEALDVVAHEMTHSVISTTSKLVYQFQSGALNESFSDILGEGCEAHFNNGVPDWKMGSSLRNIFRVFDNPGSLPSGLGRPFPSRFSQFEVLDLSQDKGGVHINSSITNHAFYLLAAGMEGAIGLDPALQIFYRAVTTKLNPQSQFVDARIACVASAKELFGDGSTEMQKTAQVFDQVEIFDQAPRQGPAPTTPVDALDSTLFIFPSGGATFLGRREAQFNDDGAGVFLGNNGQRTPVMPGKKPVVAGNGSYGLYVRPNADASFIDTMSGASTFLNFSGQIESVGLSADGTVQAYVLRTANGQPDKRIYVFDTKTNQTKTYTAVQPLTTPTTDGTSNTILSVDALDLSSDGRYVYYDALNRITFPGGGFVDSYSIYFIDRSTDTITSLIPPIPGVQVGNPSLGQTRSHLVTFDVVDANGLSYIYAADLASGALRLMTLLAAGAQVSPGWPGYSGDDTAIVYTNYSFDFQSLSYVPYLESQPVLADGMSPSGGPFSWLAGSSPNIGFIYRRGTYAGLPSLSITAVDNQASESPGNSGRWRVTRTGASTRALPFSIVLSGTAQNGTDCAAIPLNHRIEAGNTFMEIVLTPGDDSIFEGDETLTCTLAEALDYMIGEPGSATITIADNDSLSFASWATGFGINPTDFNGDADTDGRTNLMEYALGSNPKGANTVPDPQVSLSNGKLLLTVSRTRAAPDLTYTVEVSPSLNSNSWRSGTPHTTVLTDTPTLLQVVNEAAASSNTRHFIRLRVATP